MMKMAEEIIGGLVVSLLPEDRYTVVEVGKAPPTHRRRPRHNLDCDISITHLGGSMMEHEKATAEENGQEDQPPQVSVEENPVQHEEDVEEEVEWLQVSVNATTDSR